MDFEVIDFEEYKAGKEGKEYIPPKKENRPVRKKNKGLALKIAAGAVIVVAILFSPLFSIKDIVVDDMVAYSREEICLIGGIKEGDNLFLTLLRAGKKLEKDPYFKNVDMGMALPGTIKVNIEERRVKGYVSYMGSYLYIDETGLVMDSGTNFKENLPVFTGIAFDKFSIGKPLEVEDEEVLELVVRLTQLLTLHDALEKVDSVNVSDVDNITVTSGGVKVKLGENYDLEQKIRTMKEILAQLKDEDRGTLDLSDLSKPIVFKYLT